MGGGPAARGLKRWLVKSDPAEFSWGDLLASPGRATRWDGVRNYQVRNMIRDEMRPGDPVLLYHSSAGPPAVVGVAAVAGRGYPDPTQFDAGDPRFDPGAGRDAPRWYAFDLRAERALPRPVTLEAMRASPALAGMALLRRGSRLSILPVSGAEWDEVLRLGGAPREARGRPKAAPG